jgi:hypothetical protein
MSFFWWLVPSLVTSMFFEMRPLAWPPTGAEYFICSALSYPTVTVAIDALCAHAIDDVDFECSRFSLERLATRSLRTCF